MSYLDVILEGLAAAWRRVHATFSEAPVGSPVASCTLQNCKIVSTKANERLVAAQKAIEYAKEKLPYGAGNQMEALESSNFNSYYRMQTARDDTAFIIPEKAEALAQESPASFKAAKAELAQGGNCGEHAFVAYDYLRRTYPNEHIQVAQKEGFDHAFVIIGNPATEKADQLVVADAWPTKPTPVLWEDHFAYTPDKTKLLLHASSQGDARDYKQEMLDSGLSLNAEGRKNVQQSMTTEQTQREVKTGIENHRVWNHQDTAKTKYVYVPEDS